MVLCIVPWPALGRVVLRWKSSRYRYRDGSTLSGNQRGLQLWRCPMHVTIAEHCPISPATGNSTTWPQTELRPRQMRALIQTFDLRCHRELTAAAFTMPSARCSLKIHKQHCTDKHITRNMSNTMKIMSRFTRRKKPAHVGEGVSPSSQAKQHDSLSRRPAFCLNSSVPCLNINSD